MASNNLNTRIKLSEVCDVIASPVDKKSKDGEIAVRLCNYTDVYYNTVISNDMPFMAATATRDEIKKFSLKPGDVVITKDSESPDDIAIPALVGCDVKDLVCGYHLIILRAKNGFSGAYLHYLLCTQKVRYQFFKVASGITRFGLPIGAVGDVLLKFPNAEKQREIAACLSTWDRAIELHDKLIALKEKQKQGLMQVLLTGKKRLLDDDGAHFNGSWITSELDELAEIIVSPVDKKTLPGEIPVELCNYTDVYYNHLITNKMQFMKASAKPSEIQRFSLKKNDVIITKDSETPGDIAIPALVSEDLSGVLCGYHLAIVRPRDGKVDGAFLNHLFSMQKIRYYFFTRATGTTRFGLSVGGISKAQFKTPCLKEQVRIASVLTSAEKEMSALKSKKALLIAQKNGLMQQLLG